MQRKILLLILNLSIFLIGFNITFGQPYAIERKINWQIKKNNNNSEKEFDKFFSFDGAGHDPQQYALPLFHEQVALSNAGKVSASLHNTIYVVAEDDTNFTKLAKYVSSEITINAVAGTAAKEPYALISFIPLRTNPETGKLEKLVSFTLKLDVSPETAKADTRSLSKSGAKSSALANGSWHKIGLTETGVYKIDYNFLKQLGINPSGVDPRNLQIYGKPGGMLPEYNSIARDEDLVENAIKVVGEEDGVFNEGDYILFYGQGPTVWTRNSINKRFSHQINYYSDTTYYFITASAEKGKRINVQPSLTANPDRVIRSYDDYAYHEFDQLTDISKTIKSGREWYGEEFNAVNNYSFNFKFPAIDQSAPAVLRTALVARSNAASNFNISVNNSQQFTTSFSSMPLIIDDYKDYVLTKNDTFSVNPSTSFDINLKYNKTGSGAAYLNYLEMNVRSMLKFHSGQFSFRDGSAIAQAGVNEYRIQNAQNNAEVWDVTDFHNVKIQASALDNGEIVFRSASDKLMEYVAFNGSSFLQPLNFGNVPNQDLHSLSGLDMVIVTDPNFYPAAQRLANYHKERDNLNVQIVFPRQVYNEFSSGAQDVSAIRDFMKMLYSNAASKEEAPKYLLLLGAASYDYKNRIKDNSNFVPTYQSNESLKLIHSFCADDYYGFLDNNEGRFTDDEMLDIGIGRIPVRTLAQANIAVDKIERYNAPQAMQDWRNVMTFVSDDEEGNEFIRNSEGFTSYIEGAYPEINVDKIYIDAYKQVSTSSGQRYPSAMDAINRRINSGTLIFTYFGHGGEQGLAHERIVDVDAIASWTNTYKMPLFITGTCELSRFDDPGRVSAGELAVLNPKGGAIASISTTRVVVVNENERMGYYLFTDNIFKVENGKIPRLGDVLKTAKNKLGFSVNTLNYSLLGDPALRLALPRYEVVTTEINSKPVSATESDTLKALSKMTIKGIIADKNGNKLSSYNGFVYPTVYDKPQAVTTLRNDPESYKTTFYIRHSIIYKGKASVKDGEFTFSFIVPKDISYQDAVGKISYYSENGKEDAGGFDEKIVIGGTSDKIITDDKGPEVHLFINDTNFIVGGLVDDTPVLIAKVRDDIGINTVGGGIGHELTGVLNDGEPIILNNNYEPNLDDFTSGEIRYQFSTLPDGHYNLKVKVWDVANNSSEAFTDFVVASPSRLNIRKLFNYPNPFSDKTSFSFEHNLPDEELNIEVNIYDVRGALLKTIKSHQNGSSSRVNDITWDGRDDLGGQMTSGVYIYRLVVTTTDGKEAHQAQKLVIVR